MGRRKDRKANIRTATTKLMAQVMLLLDGKSFADLNRDEQAQVVALLEEVVAQKDAPAEAFPLLVGALRVVGFEPERVSDILLEGVHRHPEDRGLRVEAVVWLFDKLRGGERVPDLMVPLLDDPEPEIRWLLCETAYDEGQYDSAIEHCRHLLRTEVLSPESELNFRYRIADCRRLQGDLEGAHTDLELLSESPALQQLPHWERAAARFDVLLLAAVVALENSDDSTLLDRATRATDALSACNTVDRGNLPPLKLGGHYFSSASTTRSIDMVRLHDRLTQLSAPAITLGWIAFIAYESRRWTNEALDPKELLNAADISGDYRLQHHVAFYHLYENEDRGAALRASLRFWAGRATDYLVEGAVIVGHSMESVANFAAMTDNESAAVNTWILSEFLPTLQPGARVGELVATLYERGWGDYLQSRNDPETRSRALSRLLDLGAPFSARMWLEWASTRIEMGGAGADEFVEQALREAQRLAPEDAEVWIASAWQLIVVKRDEVNGREALNRALELQPEHPALPGLSEALLKLADPEKVIGEARLLLEDGRPADALNLLQERQLDTPIAHTLAAYAFWQLDQWQEMFAEAELGATGEHPLRAHAHWLVACAIREDLRRYPPEIRDAMLHHARQSVEFPNAPSAAYIFVAQYGFDGSEIGNHGRTKLLERAIQECPEEAYLCKMLAGHLIEMGMPGRALDLLWPRIEMVDAPTYVIWAGIMCLRAVGRTEEAIRLLRRISPDDESRLTRDLLEAMWLIDLGEYAAADTLAERHLTATTTKGGSHAALTLGLSAVRDGSPMRAFEAIRPILRSEGWRALGAASYATIHLYGEGGEFLDSLLPSGLGEIAYTILNSPVAASLDDRERGRLSWLLAEDSVWIDDESLLGREERAALILEALRTIPDEVDHGAIADRFSGDEYSFGRDPLLCLRHSLLYALRVGEEDQSRAWDTEWGEYPYFPSCGWLAGESLESLSVADRRALHREIAKILDETPHSTGASRIIAQFHRDIWSKLLLVESTGAWDELDEAAHIALELDPRCTTAMRDLAMTLAQAKSRASAMEYLGQLRSEPSAQAEDINRAEETIAAVFGAKALQQPPGKPRSKAAVKKSVGRPAITHQATDFSVPEDVLNRYLALDPFKQGILRVVHRFGRFSSYEELAEIACQDVQWVPVHVRKLEEAGLIIAVGENEYSVSSELVPLLEQESRPATQVRVVEGDGEGRFKSVFNSRRERTMFQIVRELFPAHFTYPNMALRTIFAPDDMRDHLSKAAFDFLWKGSIDIAVISSVTDMPVACIEVDSIYHDTKKQQRRDALKDEIFRVGGIRLFRLRQHGQPDLESIRGELAEQVLTVYGGPSGVPEAFQRLLRAGILVE